MGGQFLDFMGGHSCYEGDMELMGGPPTRENPESVSCFFRYDIQGGPVHMIVTPVTLTMSKEDKKSCQILLKTQLNNRSSKSRTKIFPWACNSIFSCYDVNE